MNKFIFYLLSFTWGLPMTLIGCIVALVFVITGHKPKKYGYCFYFEVGNNWGGLELGIVFLTDKTPSEHTKMHEHGHGLQNCYFGFLMPFVVCIPSAYRYWLREFEHKDMKYFVWSVYFVAILLSVVLVLLTHLTHMYWILVIAIIILVYFTILSVWALIFEIPKYKSGFYVDYDDFWVEGNATKLGTEFIKSLGENKNVN